MLNLIAGNPRIEHCPCRRALKSLTVNTELECVFYQKSEYST